MSMHWRLSASRAPAAMCACMMHQVSLRLTSLHLSWKHSAAKAAFIVPVQFLSSDACCSKSHLTTAAAAVAVVLPGLAELLKQFVSEWEVSVQAAQ